MTRRCAKRRKELPMTKIELFSDVLTFIPADRTDLTDFINHEISMVVKKNSYVSKNADKPTAKQIVNEGLKSAILATLAFTNKPMSVKDIMDNTEALIAEGVSGQRVTALLTQLKNDGKVVRSMEKKVALYAFSSAGDGE